MKVIIVGCGRLGVELAYRMYQRGHDVAVVDSIAAAFNNLPSDFQGRTIEGEALSQDVLHRAGIETADGLAAVTNQDALNAVVAHIAREIYNVPNVAVRNYDPHTREMLESFGLQIVSSTSWGAQKIEEILYHEDLHSVYTAGNGEIEVYEFVIPKEFEGKRVGDLQIEDQALPCALTRAGRAMLPTKDMMLQEGDVVYFSATMDGITELRNLVKVKK